MPEGALLRIVAAEKGLATVYEVRRATQMLQAQRKVERVQVGPPTCQRVGIDDVSVTPPRGDGAGIDNMRMALPPERLTEAQRQWTGYEIRLIRPEEQKVENGELAMRLALRMTKLTGEAKRDRWRRQDEALEAECHRIEVHDTDGGQRPIEHEDSSLTARQIAGITRASATLALISATHRAVIRSWYFDAKESLEAVGEYTAMAQEAAEAAKAPTVATMIRRRAQAASQNYDPEWVAGLRKAAEILLDEASGAYREARRAISAR